MRSASGNSPLIVTSAFPFAPAEINLAHVASTYLPADIYCRYQRTLGRDSRHVCGTDVHSVAASHDGVSRDEILCKTCDIRYREQFARMGIQFDVYERTDHPDHVATVSAALERLLHRGKISHRPTTVLRCEGCGAFLPRRLALDPTAALEGLDRFDLARVAKSSICPFCSSRRICCLPSQHWFLSVESCRAQIAAASERLRRPDVRERVENLMKGTLPDWNFSRDNSVGLPISFDPDGKTLYLWFESLIAYQTMAGLAGIENPVFHHFIGKNIVYYHGIIWPILLAEALGRTDCEFQLSVRGFMDLSKTDASLCQIETALSNYPVDYLRFYLATRVPDRELDFYLSVRELEQTCTAILCNKIGNLLHRTWSILRFAGNAPRRLDGCHPVVHAFFDCYLPQIARCLQQFEIRRAVQNVIQYSGCLNRAVSEHGLFESKSAETRGLLAFMAASLMTLLNPVVPNLIERRRFFATWHPNRVTDIPAALSSDVGETPVIWEKV
jgi:methionyl-tRNA synthetase